MSAAVRPSTTLWASDRSVAYSTFTELPSASAAARYGKPDAWKDDRLILAWYEDVKARKNKYKANADAAERKDTARISTIIERQHKKEAERKASGRDVDSLVKGDYTNYNASSSKFKAAAKFIQLKFASENNLKVAGGGLTSTAGAAAMQPKPKPNAVSTPATKESLKQPQPAAPAARVRPRTAPVRRRTSPQKRSAKDSAGGVHSKEGTRQWAVGCDRQRSNWAKVLTWQPITVKRRDPKLDPRHRNESVWVNPGVYKTLTIES